MHQKKLSSFFLNISDFCLENHNIWKIFQKYTIFRGFHPAKNVAKKGFNAVCMRLSEKQNEVSEKYSVAVFAPSCETSAYSACCFCSFPFALYSSGIW